jgi:hypothetical protein
MEFRSTLISVQWGSTPSIMAATFDNEQLFSWEYMQHAFLTTCQ